MFKGLKDRIASDSRRTTPVASPAVKTNNAKGQGGQATPQTPTKPEKPTPQDNGAPETPVKTTEETTKGDQDETSTPNQPTAAGGFFKRLEFLTPLKDQMAAKLNESRESINSLVDDIKPTNTPNKNVNQNHSGHQANDSSHPSESPHPDPASSGDHNAIDVNSITKDQLLNKVFRLEKTLHKYREKYSEMVRNFQTTLKDNEKMKVVMQQMQDKNMRRIQEMKEAADLDKQAKKHLEEELTFSLEEKEQRIEVLQTQIQLLKVGESDAPKGDDKVRSLEVALKESEEQTRTLQSELNMKMEMIEELKQNNIEERSKLVRQLKQAKSVVEQLEQDKGMAVAEAKRLTHEAMEAKDGELNGFRQQVQQLQEQLLNVETEKEEQSRNLSDKLESALTEVKNLEDEKQKIVEEAEATRESMEQQIAKRQSQEQLKIAQEQKEESLNHVKEEHEEEMRKMEEKYEQDKVNLRSEHDEKMREQMKQHE
uniref:Uncharacterized protein n=2 Tax=Ciona intestinalis TaxID=7719 RepID=F7AFQ9_CIOIN